METENPVVKGTEQALFLLSQKRSEMVFNELLEYATEICLSRPPDYLKEYEKSRYETDSTEDTLVQKIGARSLSTLLEMKQGIHAPRTDEYFHISETVTTPDSFSDPLNLRILENAERFGQALIDESFAVLGSDAPLWVERLKQATTPNEEYRVINWLDDRIQNISLKSRPDSHDDDEKDHFYPPYRISPKLIGSYPHNAVNPSCLSASIITTSFFEKAGMPVLHAGVTTPGNDAGSELLLHSLYTLINRSEDTPSESAQAHVRRVVPALKKVVEWTRRPLAQHAAIYTKLSSGWLQMDPYYDASTGMISDENDHLDSLYETLNDWHATVPNLEFSTATLPDKSVQLNFPEESSLPLILLGYEYEDETPLINTVADALKTIPAESYQSYLYETCLAPMLELQHHRVAKDDASYQTFIDRVFERADQTRYNAENPHDSHLQRAFELALKGYIQWEDSPEEFIQRCATDAAYRMRRAEDFLNMPTIMAVVSAHGAAQHDRGRAHLAVDIGSPAMRIGLATLNDFARYDNHPLPASFWVTHWPGAVSIVENIDNPFASASDRHIIYNGLLSKITHPFTSTHNYDKIYSFLSTHGKLEEDGTEEQADDVREDDTRGE